MSLDLISVSIGFSKTQLFEVSVNPSVAVKTDGTTVASLTNLFVFTIDKSRNRRIESFADAVGVIENHQSN